MPLSYKVFWFCISFIGGVLLSESGASFAIICCGVGIFFCVSLFFFVSTPYRWWGVASMCAVVVFTGAGYALVRVPSVMPVVSQGTIVGTVISPPRISNRSQNFIIALASSQKVLVYTDRFLQVAYGDTIVADGLLRSLSPQEDFARVKGVSLTLSFPHIRMVRAGSKWSFLKMLFSFRATVASVFERILPADYAALASGMLLGQESSYFSPRLRTAMQGSGTTHLVALSGYNISILIGALYVVFGYLFSRRATFFIALCCVVVFVVMTGAQSSVVRAACMGSLVIIAQHASRVYDFKQSVAVAGFFMVLLQPAIIRFDMGFILSFLSLFGIAYIMPLLHRLYTFRHPTLEVIKKLACETIGAQAMVLPLLALSFGGISLVSVCANMLILPLVGVIMFLSCFIGIMGLIALPVAQVLVVTLYPFTWFVERVISWFGSLPLTSLSFSWWGVVAYYGFIVFILYRFRDALGSEAPLSLRRVDV